MKGIADTGLLVAFVNRGDKHHDWALAVAAQIREPLLTCEAVLAETAFHLHSSASALALIQTGMVTVAFTAGPECAALARLAAKYAGRQPDLADLCLIRMSELHPRHVVVTTDVADFRVYRRHQREAIPLLAPPATGR